MKQLLPKLKYSYDALEPYIDAKTMEIHHTKHHQAYIDKFNLALESYPKLQEKPVEELLREINSIPEEIRIAIRNHGGGHLNHSLFWEILKKQSNPDNNKPKGEILSEINKKFGSYENFKELFSKTATNHFGSGWAWLILNKEKKLEIIETLNQDSPLMNSSIPLLCLDVWEHAYYLKYQNKRPEYIEAFFKIINWDKVNELFKKSL